MELDDKTGEISILTFNGCVLSIKFSLKKSSSDRPKALWDVRVHSSHTHSAKDESHSQYDSMFSELGQSSHSAMTSATLNCVLPSTHTLVRDTDSSDPREGQQEGETSLRNKTGKTRHDAFQWRHPVSLCPKVRGQKCDVGGSVSLYSGCVHPLQAHDSWIMNRFNQTVTQQIYYRSETHLI